MIQQAQAIGNSAEEAGEWLERFGLQVGWVVTHFPRTVLGCLMSGGCSTPFDKSSDDDKDSGNENPEDYLDRQPQTQSIPKPGSSGGPGAGKPFPDSTKDAAEAQAGGKCVFCGKKTTRTPGPKQRHTDHAIPKSRNGNNTLPNAQNTCRTCNLKKRAKTTKEFLRDLLRRKGDRK